ncbi:MAG TPA: CBS domain-containing protein [Verrucomicrobiae bacterium]|jgi:CBS domain-containing protein|nr:CBS domain-containing protein [Verrucomicrobiae bacterium]
MKVRDVLKEKGTQVWTIVEHEPLPKAVRQLVEHNIGALIVLDAGNRIAGIISERDIMRECHRNLKGLDTTPVSKIMTRKVIIGSLEDDLDYLMGIMTKNRVRHIPILDKDEIAGMVSIGDLVKAKLKDSQYENQQLKEYFYGQ